MNERSLQRRDPWALAVLALHVTTFAVLLWWSWRRWPEPLIDFGRELYLPWQIDSGKVLYRDLASLFGPLSPYVNALWFRLFGPSLMTLAICNLVIFAATVAGVYHLVRVSTDRLTASAAGLTTLVLFGFSQYVDSANYNFVTPYSHEATHGIALSVATLLLLHRSLGTRSRRFCAAAGAAFGLVLLTKPEIAVAAATAVIAGWLAAYALGDRDRRELALHVPIFIAMSLAPSLLFFLYFSTQMDVAAALRATGGAWVPLAGTGIVENAFYRRSMGLEAPVANAWWTLLAFGGFIAFAAAAVAVASVGAGTSRSSPMRQAVRTAVLVAAVLVLGRRAFPRALPLIALTTVAATIVLFARARRDREQALRLVPLVLWSPFALVLLGKLGLNARISHYGFYLAMPAMVSAIVLVVWVIPHALASWRSKAVALGFRQVAPWMLAAAMVPYIWIANESNRTKTVEIGSGADRFYASAFNGLWHGRAVREAVQALGDIAPRNATLAVLPEGVMVNYLLRLESPLRVINLMPPELMAFGEDDVLRSLEARPPDFVLLVNRDTSEYGYPTFGSEPRYGLKTLTWIDARYESVGVIRKDETSDSEIAMRILRRRLIALRE